MLRCCYGLRFQMARWRCLLRRVLFGVFGWGWLPQPDMPPSWIAATEGGLTLALRVVWPRCCDADTGWVWENIRFLVLSEVVQCALCAENWAPGSSSQETHSLYELVEVESDHEPEPLRARWWIPRVRTCLTSRRELA